MKTIRSIVAAFFCSVILSVIICSCAPETIESPDIFDRNTECVIDSLSEEYMMQVKAYENYTKILNIMSQQTRSANSLDDYPDYYGGSYINDENKLVVLIKREYLTTRDANSIQTEVIDDVVYEPCENSYNRMIDIIDSIKNTLAFNPESLSHVSMLGIDDASNRVFVCFSDDYTENVLNKCDFGDNIMVCYQGCRIYEESFSRVVNSGEATFPPAPPTYPALLCGDSIYTLVGGGTYGGSIGYRAIDSFGEEGFVTAGHNVNLSGSVYCPHTWEKIGLAVESYYKVNNLDAAFCVVENGKFSLTNNINYTIKGNPATANWDTLSTHIVSKMLKGTIVYMSGMRSKNQQGRVISSYATYPIKVDTTDNKPYNDSIAFRDVVLSDYPSQSGDSGGIVYTKRRINNVNGTNCTVGIHVAYADSIVVDNKKIRPVVCIKAEHINRVMGLSRY